MTKGFLIIALVVLSSSCKKEKTGDVTFWQASGSGTGVTVVELNSVTSNITSEYANTPECSAAGCAVFNGLEVGTYTYSATDGVDVWEGSLKVNEGCNTVELY
jgi:hypothetical protein